MAYRRRFRRCNPHKSYNRHQRAMYYHMNSNKKGFLRKVWYHEACCSEISQKKRCLTRKEKRYLWNRFKNS